MFPSYLVSRWRCTAIASLLTLTSATADVRISELMFHPQHAGLQPEPVAQEFIEILNTGPSAVDLTSAQLTSGVSFTFPSVSISPGAQLVIAADPATFSTLHPTVPTNAILGPWTGKLSNSGETVRLRDPSGNTIDAVTYSDDGDWATRVRGPVDNNHRGWKWETPADGQGHSLELVNPTLTNNHGRNWAPSTNPGGTPAAPNSTAATDIAPLLTGQRHDPPIPRSTDPVTISCQLTDEAPGAAATLHYRTADTGPFTTLPMVQAGATHAATVPPQPDLTVVEFYITATDATSNTRTWPAPARQVDGAFAQSTNALYQVDDTHDPDAAPAPGAMPLARVVLTQTELDELDYIGNYHASKRSNAQMNITFISHDAAGTRVRYLAGIRNRGASSRFNNPNNQLVVFRGDDPWDGRRSVKFNAVNPPSQVLGSVLFRRFGIETAEAVPAQLRLNGRDDATPGTPMFGAYAMVEGFESEYTANHWPGNSGGNLYQVRDDPDTGEGGELQWEGPAQDPYRNTYFKQTNRSADDFSDLIALTDALNNTPQESLFATASSHAHLSQWARMAAVDNILGNREGGLITRKGDDYVLYSGSADPRFYLVPHDLDSLGAAGTSQSPTSTFLGYADVEGFIPIFNNSEFLVLFYSHLLDLTDNLYTHEVADPIIDATLGGWVDAARIAAAKSFIAPRTTYIADRINRTFTTTTNLPITTESYHHTTTGAVNFSGKIDVARTLSVLVAGQPATLNHRAATWSLSVPAESTFLHPGLNRVPVRAYTGKGGTGELIFSTHLEVWNETGTPTSVSGNLVGTTPAGTASLRLRPDYLPSIPVLVSVELLDAEGAIDTSVWDATATLSSTDPSVTLSPDTVTLYNGRGSALVTVTGAAPATGGSTSTTFIPAGASWRYLDDGSNQETAWRNPGFDDSTWESGDAELGYGDTQTTEIDFVDADPDTPGVQKNATTYFRTTFDLADPSTVSSLNIALLYDDGAIVYINGAEAARTFTMGPVDGYDQYTALDSPSETTFFDFPVSPSLLVAGQNTVAVELHQGSPTSSDASFNLALTATTTEPVTGGSTIVADVAGHRVTRTIAELGSPAVTTVAGTLPGSATTWSGVVHVTADVTVPAGHTLTITPGTLVLVDGDDTPGSTTASDIIVRGTLVSDGTDAAPITFTASQPGHSWGQFLFDSPSPSTFRYTHVHRAGHAPRGGHTFTGRCFHVLGTDLTFEHCTLTDNFGKLGGTFASGGRPSHLTFRNCHLARSPMGFETDDTSVLLDRSHITEMLSIYREDGINDDNDGIYLHSQGNRLDITLSDSVVARIGDDGIDTSGAHDVKIINTIVRNCADKGISVGSGSAALARTTLTANRVGIAAKNDGHVTIDHTTIAENSTAGIQVTNKSGSDAPSFYTITNSIILDPDAISSHASYPETNITLNYNILGEPWPFTGSANNTVTDPLFVDAPARNFHLTATSPAIDTADPAAPLDPDGSPADIGRFPYSPTIPQITWSPEGAPYHITGDATVPPGSHLTVQPGTAVYFDQGTTLNVLGTIHAVGTPDARIQFNAPPGESPVPKFGGIQLVDSMSPDNRIAHLDIANAGGPTGAIGIIRSQCIIDAVTFYSSHSRMLYTEDSTLTLEHSTFHNMFATGEDPAALGRDTDTEQLKTAGTIPADGHLIVRHNTFGSNAGSNNIVSLASAARPAPLPQLIANTFAPSTAPQVASAGEAYLAENIFRGSTAVHANATVSLARNIFWDATTAVAVRENAAAIFEHNTLHSTNPSGTAISFYDPATPSENPGQGALATGNIFSNLSTLFSGIDAPAGTTTSLESSDNFIDAPGFIAPHTGDFRLAQGSPATGKGALTPSGIWITGEPPAVTTSTSATLTVGAPGIFAYRWRLDAGAWSPDIEIPPARTATITLTNLPDGSHTVEVEGRNFAGNWQTSPTVSNTWTVTATLPATVRINEILATGSPDTVELFNPGAAPYDLSGHHLTDNPANPAKFTIAPGTTLAAGGYLVIALDPNAFSLSSSGESLTLFTPDATTVLDSITFGHQPAGFTLGRTGHDATWTLTQPTLGTTNIPQPTAGTASVYISEFLTSGQIALQDDFIELTNPGSLPVDLSGLRLTDNPNSQPSLYTVPPLSYIGPGAAAAFTAGTHLNFGLASFTEHIALLSPDGFIIDAHLYISQTTDQATVIDPAGVSTFSRLPTPGLNPPTGDPAYTTALALFDNLRITEIMYDPSQGTDFEFVEFQNIGTTTLDLTGLRVTSGIDFTFPALTLAPGAYTIIVSSRISFESLYGNALPVAGEYSGKLSNGGEEIVVLLPEPYEAAILRFTYDDSWHPTTDGLGKSLVFSNPSRPVFLWGRASSWVPSSVDGGTPAGFSTTATGFPAWLNDNTVTGADKDIDLDGINHLLEYVLGLDPNTPESLDFAVGIDPSRNTTFSFPLPDPTRPDTTIVIETSSSLDDPDWVPIATKVGQEPWTGAVPVSLNTVTLTGGTLEFFRIGVFLTP